MRNLLLAVLLTQVGLVWAQGTAPEKKLIAVGWDMANAERMRANMEEMDTTPFHGCSVRFAGPKNTPAMWYAFGRDVWDEQVIAQIIEDLKATEPQRLRHRFLLVNANPGDVDWFDDEGWATIVDHWRTAARVAREGGLVGIMFDPEAYREPWRQFDWSTQPQVDQHSFAEYRDKARQRGREVMASVASEYPDATILALFLLSVAREAAERADPVGALSGHAYGLLPSFIDGWLDVAPPTITLVDGCERAYLFNREVDYLASANLIRNKCQRLISPENRYKYRAQVQVGFGVYLDAYVNPPESNWYINPGDQTPVRRLIENVSSALEVADEYVWIYGEQASWWPSPHPAADKVRWPEKFPGVDDALWLAADPRGHAMRILNEAGERENLLVNADFSSATTAATPGTQPADWKQGTAPPNWSFWQTGASKGRPSWDREVGHDAPGSGSLTAVKSGCLIQWIPASAGERYLIAGWRRIQGEGTGAIRVRWQTAEGKWHAETLDRFISAPAPESGWELLAGTVVVPEGAGRIVLLLMADGQRSEQDVIWWDDMVAFRIE